MRDALNWLLLGFGTLLCIGGGISIMVLIDILKVTYSNPAVVVATGSIALGILCIIVQLVWNPGNWTD